VRSALLSDKNGFIGRLRNLSIAASVASAVIEASVIDTKIAGPKYHTYRVMPGIMPPIHAAYLADAGRF